MKTERQVNEVLSEAYFRELGQCMNDLSVMLKRKWIVGRLRVMVAEERVEVLDWTWRRLWR